MTQALDQTEAAGLISSEREALARHEAVIERGKQTFVEVGRALAAIRDDRLYRSSHSTFEAYCKDRWSFGRTYAHRLIDSAAIAEMLPVGDTPANEAQARELLPLKDAPAEMAEVWMQAREVHGDAITAAKIREVVDAKGAKVPDDEWYTPGWIFDTLAIQFALDVCAPVDRTHSQVPADRHLTIEDDGLACEWSGTVWCNPPYSSATPWASRMIEHGDGLLLTHIPMNAQWCVDVWQAADALRMIPNVEFVRPDGSLGRPGYWLQLAAFGQTAVDALRRLGAPTESEGDGRLVPGPLLSSTCTSLPSTDATPADTADWTDRERSLHDQMQAGLAVVVNVTTDHRLIAWAHRQGRVVRVDHSSDWMNPFRLDADGDRDEVCDAYAELYLPAKTSLLEQLDTLRGRALACWCSPERCHADEIARRVNARAL